MDLGALAVGSYGQILTVKILLAFVSFGLAAVLGVMSPGHPRDCPDPGDHRPEVSATVVLLATALVP